MPTLTKKKHVFSWKTATSKAQAMEILSSPRKVVTATKKIAYLCNQCDGSVVGGDEYKPANYPIYVAHLRCLKEELGDEVVEKRLRQLDKASSNLHVVRPSTKAEEKTKSEANAKRPYTKRQPKENLAADDLVQVESNDRVTLSEVREGLKPDSSNVKNIPDLFRYIGFLEGRLDEYEKLYPEFRKFTEKMLNLAFGSGKNNSDFPPPSV